MVYTKLTNQAIRLCFESHKDQIDQSGIPYVFHPYHLAEQMQDEVTTITALLHDVVDDTETTFEDLIKMGFPNEVIEALKLLTHAPEVPYMEYVEQIKTNPVATAVKIADLKHNMDLTRYDTPVTEYDLKRNEKYQKALDFLTK